ncbi:hypothetical protein F4811DRAFT_4515 [Daldinia bambusicola]|nr:hypothetical protein F4811DRAFT_4515 [Daldinia bambusicola]
MLYLPQLASLIKKLPTQLTFTTYLSMRGSWLSALASHTFGMAVELRLNDTIIWESAGSNGPVIFELGEYQVDASAAQTVPDRKFAIVEAPNATAHHAILNRVPIRAVFSSLISREPRIDSSFETIIRQAICRTVLYHANSELLSSNASFGAIKETANAFGFEDSFFNSIDSHPSGLENPRNKLRALDTETFVRLRDVCGNHLADCGPYDFKLSLGSRACMCAYIGGFIAGFAACIYFLHLCHFDADHLNICEDVLLDFRIPL